MKETFRFVLVILLVIPSLLVFNESGNLWINAAGLLYSGVKFFLMFGNTKKLEAWLSKVEKYEEHLMDAK